MTLSEQVNSIVKNNSCKSAKAKALFDLGISKYEVQLLLKDNGIERNREMRKAILTFGVEIECLLPRDEFRLAAENNGLQYQYEIYNHTDNKKYYKFVTDSSIIGSNPIECVSPVLNHTKAGLKSLELCCKTLNEANARVNRSTGLHVHIGASHLSEKEYCNVFVNYMRLEHIIDSFMAESRRKDNSRWCKSLIGKRLDRCETRRDIIYAFDGNRYYKVNACSYDRHHTIEFRQHQGTTDFQKISAWVNFCAKLVAWSKDNLIEENACNSIDDIPFLTESEKSFFKHRKTVLA